MLPLRVSAYYWEWLQADIIIQIFGGEFPPPQHGAAPTPAPQGQRTADSCLSLKAAHFLKHIDLVVKWFTDQDLMGIYVHLGFCSYI